MRVLLLPFFIAHLLLIHTGFATLMLRDKLQKHKSFLLILILSFFLVGVGLLNNSLSSFVSLSSRSQTVGIPKQNYPLTILDTPDTKNLETTTHNAVSLAELAATNQKLLLLHPTHRDILLNQLILSSYLEKTADTQQILESLTTIDPNHPLVKKFSKQ
jgi:hypothetical protein